MAKTPTVRTESTDEPPRLTARQRRIEQQRQKIEVMRRDQRRKRAIWGTVILVVFAVVVALAMVLMKPPSTAEGRQLPIEGQQHVAQGTAITYRSRPPTSGPHYEQPAGYQFYERPVEAGNWVHTLEHGGVVVLYNCPDGCPDVVSQLRDVYESAPPSARWGRPKMAVVPYTEMDHQVAVVAWGWVDEMDAVDKDRILAFYRAHVDRGPEAVF